MYIIRGERLLEPGYMDEVREQRPLNRDDDLKYHEEQLDILRREREELLTTRRAELEKYDIYRKPLDQLTIKERKTLVASQKNMQVVLLGEKSEGPLDISDESVENARSVLSIFNKDPLTEVEDSIKYHEGKIEKINEQYRTIFPVALNRSAITRENIDELKKWAKKILDAKFVLKIAIDDNIALKSNDEPINYTYNKEETQLLLELDAYLKEQGHSGLVITEIHSIKEIRDFSKAWSMDQVVNANNTIDAIANEINENNFSPFEAIMYIHKWASGFKYTDATGTEESRVLPSILNSEYIVCSGYATLVKAVVDKIKLPGLTCDLVGCSIIEGGKIQGHCHNLVHIIDEKYQINGDYVEDACWDSALNKEGWEKGTGFSHCLYSVNDVLNFSKGIGYFNAEAKGRLENLLFDPAKFQDAIKTSNANIFQRILANLKEKKEMLGIPDIVKKYGETSDPITIEKYEEALRFICTKTCDNHEKIDEIVEKEMENSKINAAHTFSVKSNNAFIKAVDKKTVKAMQKKTKGQNAIQ